MKFEDWMESLSIKLNGRALNQHEQWLMQLAFEMGQLTRINEVRHIIQSLRDQYAGDVDSIHVSEGFSEIEARIFELVQGETEDV